MSFPYQMYHLMVKGGKKWNNERHDLLINKIGSPVQLASLKWLKIGIEYQ